MTLALRVRGQALLIAPGVDAGVFEVEPVDDDARDVLARAALHADQLRVIDGNRPANDPPAT